VQGTCGKHLGEILSEDVEMLELKDGLLGTTVWEFIELASFSSEAYRRTWAGQLYGMLENIHLDTIGNLKRTTYNWWFATSQVEEDGQSEPGYPPEMPRYFCWTDGN
jgi:hypothetical protein